MQSISIGILQVLFLSGAIGAPIQHCEIKHDGYDILLFPCKCLGIGWKPTVHIMWMRAHAKSASLNHIIPLVPNSGNIAFWVSNVLLKYYFIIVRGVSVTENPPEDQHWLKQFDDHCLMGKFEICQASQHDTHWIQCVNCKGWYHSRCVGIPQGLLHENHVFTCCIKQTPEQNDEYVVHNHVTEESYKKHYTGYFNVTSQVPLLQLWICGPPTPTMVYPHMLLTHTWGNATIMLLWSRDLLTTIFFYIVPLL